MVSAGGNKGGLNAEAQAFQKKLKVGSTIAGIIVITLLLYVFGSSTSIESATSVTDGDSSVATTTTTHYPAGVQIKTKIIERNDEGDLRCHQVCTKHRKSREKHFDDMNLLDKKHLNKLVKHARAKMVTKLQEDYGKEYFSKIFEAPPPAKTKPTITTSTNSSAELSPPLYRGVMPITNYGQTWNRFHRKLLMKVLSVQIEIQRRDKDIEGCDCIHGDKEIRKPDSTMTRNLRTLSTESESASKSPLSPPSFQRFIWATGGHSASAGHGNLYNETYTVFMERAVKDVFKSIGIDFEGRNYGMGGTDSGPELSMCSEAIYGSDLDVLSWDFGMTDGREEYKMYHYAFSAAKNPGRPTFVGMHMGGRSFISRESRLREIEFLGLPVFYTTTPDMSTSKDMWNEVPDTLGMSEEQIKALPDYIRSFKCGGKMEAGDPHCSAEKYNEYVCPSRKGKVSWHPGVKSHAFDGNMIALFLADALVRVVKAYSDRPDKDPEVLLAELQKEEDETYKDLFEKQLPESALRLGEIADPAIDVELLYKGPNLCRTARLPAQSRYLGYTTDTDKVGDIAMALQETYDVGINRDVARREDANGELRLAYIPGDRSTCSNAIIAPDYKDYFVAFEKDGWSKTTIPNEKEKIAYRYDPQLFKGIIVLHLGLCDWGKCEKGDMNTEHVKEGKVEMQVNGIKVANYTSLKGGRNLILKGEENGYYWKPNDNGTYDLSVRILEPNGFIRIYAIVLY